MKPETGGSAFPSGRIDMVYSKDYPHPRDPVWTSTGGMTLRDYFAGQVLAGLWANPREDFAATTREYKAVECYRQANAMIRESLKEKE